MAMQWQTMHVPLAAGRNAGAVDPRALPPPALSIAKDVQFDEQGGLQLRFPYQDVGTDIFGGGSLANVRKVVANGDELLCFTKTALYSWNAQLAKWVLKATYLAPKVDEQARFAAQSDQYDCDRAELSNTVVIAWRDGSETAIYVAAVDKTTGSVLTTPTIQTGERPRLVALSTKILLLYKDISGNLVAKAIDPAAPASALAASATTVLAAANFGDYYDACRVIGADTAFVGARRATTTSYTIATVTAGLVVTASTKARTCDGPIAVSSHPSGSHVQVIRANATNIQGDLLTSAFVDVFTAQAVGTASTTPVDQIAAAHRSVQNSGAYRCYVWWSDHLGGTIVDGDLKYNWVATDNTLGAQAAFLTTYYGYDLASRAFEYDGHVYLFLVFGAFSLGSDVNERPQLQNTYFLYRDDELLIAKACANKAGGFLDGPGTAFPSQYSATVGRLPGVQLVDGSTGFAWCGNSARIIATGGGNVDFSERAPREIKITFDSEEARRCIRFGETLYLTGGQVLQYDGTQLVEVGFHVFPYYLITQDIAVGSLANGSYTYKETYEWQNAKGEIDRSTTATYATEVVSGGPVGVDISLMPLSATLKYGIGSGLQFAPRAAIWRTLVDPPEDAPFYLVSSRDPSTAGSANGYLTAASTSFTDSYADGTARNKEADPEVAGVLENLSPPPATIAIANHNRMFLAGVAGEPHRIWYSKQRSDGEVAAFNDGLVVEIPVEAGAITALAFQEESLVAFTADAIYVLPGDGFDNTGGGSNFGPPRVISSDCGAVKHETVARTPLGLVFKSSKGWYLLRGWTLEYIGGPVADFDSDDFVAVHVVEAQHQVRCVSKDPYGGAITPDPDAPALARILVWDYAVNQWAEWSVANAVGATLWQGQHTIATDADVLTQAVDYTGVDYGIDVETAWIKLADLQGYGRVRWLSILGEYRSAHRLRVRLARDYQTFTQLGRLDTGDISPPIATDGADWAAELEYAGGDGETFSIGFQDGNPWVIEVRDGERFDTGTGLWSTDAGNIGVRIQTDNTPGGEVTVADLEASLVAANVGVSIRNADVAPTKVIDPDVAVTCDGTFDGFSSTPYFDDKVWTPKPTVAGGPLQLRIGPSVQRVEAIKVRITAVANDDGTGVPSGEALKLTSLALEVGLTQQLYRRLPAAQKA